MTRSHRRWGWFLNFGNFGGYGNFGNSSCLRGRCCFSDYGAYVRFRAITGDLLPSAYSVSSVFQRCWGWFLNFGNSGDYGNFGNFFIRVHLSRLPRRSRGALPWITGDLLPSAYSAYSVFQRCWGWFLNFGNSVDYGKFGNSPCLVPSVVGVAFPITALTCDSARSRAIFILRLLRFLCVSKVSGLVSQFWQFLHSR